jgi:plasmid stabilization system protein ParE
MISLPRIRYTVEARRDLARCRQFLRRHARGSVRHRMRELMEAVRTLREFPEMNRVRHVIPGSALPLRRHNAGQFVIAYVYFRPSESEPHGLISLRAFRHGGVEDALWTVRESTLEERPWTFLSTRQRTARHA